LLRIYEFGRARDTVALLEALESDEPEVRGCAARQLGGLRNERAIYALARFLADGSDSVQRV
jgi:HEAT repeat protein